MSFTGMSCSHYTVANVENNENKIENNNGSGHIHFAFFPVSLTFVSYYSAFFHVLVTDMNVSNNLKYLYLSLELGRKQNNVTQTGEERTRM